MDAALPSTASPDFSTPRALIKTDSGELAHYCFGEGPDVVALHGWPLSAATYRHLVPHLASHFRVHLFDLPGTGATRWRGPVRFQTTVAAVRTAIDTLGLERYALLAHDSGGVTARLLAADDRRVAGLVLIGSEIPGHHALLLEMLVGMTRAPGGGALLMRAVQVGAFRRSILGFGSCFTDPAYADGEFLERFVRPLGRPEVARGQLALLDGFSFADVDALREVHGRIQAPTLCVWGDRDPYFPIEKARAMLPQFKGGATLTCIPKARLFPHEDRADEVASAVVPFLAGRLATHAT